MTKYNQHGLNYFNSKNNSKLQRKIKGDVLCRAMNVCQIDNIKIYRIHIFMECSYYDNKVYLK